MPVYEYLCHTCESRFTERQKMTDAEIEICPGCGGRVKRLISGGRDVFSRSSGSSKSEIGADLRSGCSLGSQCCGAQSCPRTDEC